MKNSTKINNIGDLRGEVRRLQTRRKEQAAYLAAQYELLKIKVNTPFRVFQRVSSHIPGANMFKGMTSEVGKAFQRKDADWLTRVLQVGAPLLLNSTILRKAGWIKKALVLLASETAIGQVNREKVSGLLHKITALVKPKKKKRKGYVDVEQDDEPVAAPQAPIFEDDRYTGA